jgi:hypothetical protein
MADITIVTVNWHSAGWIRRLLDNLLRKSSGHHSLKALILDNANGADPDLAAPISSEIPCTLQPVDCRDMTGSRAHAFALNRAMELVRTRFVLVIDPDVHVFAPRWDALCIDALSAGNVRVIGAPYPRWKVGKYHDFPSPVFCFFRRELADQLPMDWRPYNDYPWCNAGVFILRQIGRLGGLLNRRMYDQSAAARAYAKAAERWLGTFSQDTGWRIARAARQRKLASILFDDMMPQDATTLDAPADPVWIELAREFELFAFTNRPVLIHRYGSGGRPWRTAKGADESFWFERIDKAEAMIQGTKPQHKVGGFQVHFDGSPRVYPGG